MSLKLVFHCVMKPERCCYCSDSNDLKTQEVKESFSVLDRSFIAQS